MKAVVINFALIFLVVALYLAGFFEFFTHKSVSVLWGAIAAIVILFIIAIKVIGLPQNNEKPRE